MKKLFEKLGYVLSDKIIRRRIVITLFLLVIFRLLAIIPIPGIDTAKLTALFQGNQFLGLLNIFSGGSLSRLSIVMLGVGPYITSSIIMQLLTMLSPRLKAMYQEEGQAGRMQFAQYSRMITIPLAMIQGYSFLTILQTQGIIDQLTTFALITNILLITGGSILLMWIGERISEFGIGNGTSLIIFAGIIAALPTTITQYVYTNIYPVFDPAILPSLLGILIGGIVVTYAVVIISEAERPIPVTYAKQVRGNKVYGGVSTYLPLRLNQAGVIPIIFALSILLFPQILFRFLDKINNTTIHTVSAFVIKYTDPSTWTYAIVYFIFVFAFTYFYTAMTFDPTMISTNLQKNGAFIPGVRPGHSTAIFISRILTRLTAFGALFLAIIAILPIIVQKVLHESSFVIGGTALLIIVSVIIDLIKKTEAQVSVKEY
jgi:preprotein translocase subunit SecY